MAKGLESMSAEEKEKIRKRYSKVGRGSAIEISDEINAHFAEQTLSNKNILKRLVEKEPSVKEKILNFFTGAQTEYSNEKLSGAAKKLFKQYKKLFDEFSAMNYQTNANEVVRIARDEVNIKYAQMNGKTFSENVKEIATKSS